MRFARDWGFGQLIVANLFAFRTSSPRLLRRARAPIGRHNDRWIRELGTEAHTTIVAWGNEGGFLERDSQVLALLRDPHCLEITKRGHPKHPLYVKASARIQPMQAT